MLVENNEAGISARQTRQRTEQDLVVSQLGYLASPAHQAASAQVHNFKNDNLHTVKPILHTWFRDSCFACDSSSTIQVSPLLFNIHC